MTETAKMTKEDLMKKVAELEENLIAERSKSVNMKDRVKSCLDSGLNNIDDIAKKFSTTNKNISSVLTALRKDYMLNGQTVISQTINNKTMLAVVNLKDLGWL